MLRISRLTDYGTVILADLAGRKSGQASASDVAAQTGLSTPTVQKLLKKLAKSGLVLARRGVYGGYRLSRPPGEISAAEIIDALEGPVSITECSVARRHCDIEAHCTVGGAWQRINVAIRRALADISLADLQVPSARVPSFDFAGMPVRVERKPG